MRIIAGKYKGRRLATIRGTIRPTPEKLRESLFNSLGEDVEGSVWLDLFAGSGAVGIEAISRGARHVVFNDRDRKALTVLRRNLELCGLSDQCQVFELDSFTLLRRLSNKLPFSYVFLDPPYRFQRYTKLLSKITTSSVLAPEFKIIIEVSKKTPADFLPEELGIEKTLRVGDSHLLILSPDNSRIGS